MYFFQNKFVLLDNYLIINNYRYGYKPANIFIIKILLFVNIKQNTYNINNNNF